MSKRGKEDPLVAEIQDALMPGHFVPYNDVTRFTQNLDEVHERFAALVGAGEAERALRLYEIFLAGVYAKIEECDDDGYLSMSFTRAFCGWIEARQAVGRSAEETVDLILKWKENDNYGFCCRIETEVAKVLDQEARDLFIAHLQGLVEQALPSSAAGRAKAIFEYENDLRLPALALKGIFESLKDVQSYAALCEKLGFSPLDCERLAEMEMSHKYWAKALGWVDKGMALESARDWGNESSRGLEQFKPEILSHLGRKDEALASAWADFQESPNEMAYEELMRYVPKSEKSLWQERAMAAAAKADLGQLISLCVKAKDWERLTSRVHSAKHAELEALSHYCSEPAAKGLGKKNPLAAAKLYRALGLRILNAGKSKYYREALAHFKQARDLYCGAGQALEWQALVAVMRRAHSRKSGFMSEFELIVSGKSPQSHSFAEQAQKRWKRLTS